MDLSRMLDRRRGRRDRHWAEARWYYRTDPEGEGEGTGESATVLLVDLSISGAGLMTQLTPAVTVGSLVGLEFRGANGTVTVRRIDPCPDADGLMLYGVEFTEPITPLTAELHDAFYARTLWP